MATAISTQTMFLGHSGPFFDSNNKAYVVTTSGGTDVSVWGATSRTGTWTELDTANEPNNSHGTDAVSAWIEGTEIYVVVTATAAINLYTFRTSAHASADTWSGLTSVTSASGWNNTAWNCRIVVRTDNAWVVLHNGSAERVHGTDYDRVYYSRSGTTNVAVSAAGDQNHHWAYGCGRGDSNKIYFHYKEVNTGHILKHLDASYTLSAASSSFGGTGGSESPIGRMPWNGLTGASEKVYAGYNLSTACYAISAYYSGSTWTLGTIRTFTGAGAGTPYGLACNTSTQDLYGFYYDTTATDLYYRTLNEGGAWGTGTLLESLAATTNGICAQMGATPDGTTPTVLYRYDTGGNVYYTEIAIAAAAVTRNLTLLGVG